MRLISWNVNGLRACIQKGFLEQFDKLQADFFCLQETKLQEGQLELELPGYLQYWCYAQKKGYSGTAIFTKHVPISVSYGLGIPELDTEGRLITLEYPEFYLVTCYTPNAQRGLARIDHRMAWDEAFRAYIARLDEKRPVILCGDLNVAYQEIDLKNPGSNRGNAGFSDQERDSFTKTLELGFTDTFRYLHPEQKGAYTWWSYMYNARQNNAGWRIDYFLVSDRLKEAVFNTPIYSDILGSDHCPVGLELDTLCNGSIWTTQDEESAAQANPAPGAKAKTVLKAGVKIGVLAVLTAGLLFGAARFRTVKSLEPEVTTTLETVEWHWEVTAYSAGTNVEPLHSQFSSQTNYSVESGGKRWVIRNYVGTAGKPNCWIHLRPVNSKTGETVFISEDAAVSEVKHLDVCCAETSGDVERCYAVGKMGSLSKFDGWFFYGKLGRDTQIEMTVGDSTVTFLAQPDITSTAAARMTDDERLYYVAHSEQFLSKKDLLTEDVTWDQYLEIVGNTQMMIELTKCREEAAPYALNNPQCQGAALIAMLFSMDSINLADITFDRAQTMTTQQLAWHVLSDRDLFEQLSASSETGLWMTWWESGKKYPAVWALELREDYADTLLAYCTEYNGNYRQEFAALILSLALRGSLTSEQRSQFEAYLASVAKYRLESITEEAAKEMTTAELVQTVSASHLDPNKIFGMIIIEDATMILSSYVSSSSVMLPINYTTQDEDSYYLEFCETFSVFRELESRADAVQCMMEFCKESDADSDEHKRIQFLLRQVPYLEKMTDAQAQEYLSWFTEEDLSWRSTSSLVDLVLEKIMPMVMHRMESGGKSYSDMKELFPALWELGSRSDAPSYILDECFGTGMRAERIRRGALLLLEQEPLSWRMGSFRQKYASAKAMAITEEEAAQMSTARLVEDAVHLIYQKKVVSYIFTGAMAAEKFAQNYPALTEWNPVFSELETREDALQIMRTYHAQLSGTLVYGESVDSRYRLIIEVMAALDVYRNKMTVQDAVYFLNILLGYDLAEKTTSELAMACLDVSFIHSALSQAATAQEAEAAYMELLKTYPVLAEMEGRSDAIQILLLICDKNQERWTERHRQSALSLLCLNRYYSRMTTQEKIRLAQYLLGYTDADGEGFFDSQPDSDNTGNAPTDETTVVYIPTSPEPR